MGPDLVASPELSVLCGETGPGPLGLEDLQERGGFGRAWWEAKSVRGV